MVTEYGICGLAFADAGQEQASFADMTAPLAGSHIY